MDVFKIKNLCASKDIKKVKTTHRIGKIFASHYLISLSLYLEYMHSYNSNEKDTVLIDANALETHLSKADDPTQPTHEKMLNIISLQRNANQNHEFCHLVRRSERAVVNTSSNCSTSHQSGCDVKRPTAPCG